MQLLLVDDRDGRIVAELESEEQALRLLETLGDDDPENGEHLCIVRLHSRRGAMLSTESSVKIH